MPDDFATIKITKEIATDARRRANLSKRSKNNTTMKKPRTPQMEEDDNAWKLVIPKYWLDQLKWAVDLFGSGAVVAAVFGWALIQVYEDQKAMQIELHATHKAQNEALIMLMREEVKARVEMTVTLNELKASISREVSDSQVAHERVRAGGGEE
jgi:hypothetical protein